MSFHQEFHQKKMKRYGVEDIETEKEDLIAVVISAKYYGDIMDHLSSQDIEVIAEPDVYWVEDIE